MQRLLVVAVVLSSLASCKDRDATKRRPAPSVSTVASAIAAPRTPAPLASVDAGAPARPLMIAVPEGDGGAPTSCRLIYGPAQDPFTGPATLVASARGMEVVQHRNGLAVVRVLPITPVANAKSAGRAAAIDPTEKASKPPCAVAGKFAFCSDAKGNVHKSLREMASDEIVGKSVPGARLTAASLGGDRTVFGYVERRRTDNNGEVFEAWAKLDGDPPIRISEDGSGTSDVVFAAGKPGEVFAWMIDARVSMTPVHTRVLRYTTRLEIGPDVVVHVAGGSTRFLHGALATNDQGTVVGLLAASSDRGFGLVAVPLDVTVKEDAPFTFSPYPNGLDGAPLAATSGGRTLLIARVRPSRAPGEPTLPGPDASTPLPPHVLEIGRIDATGSFSSLGIVPSQGSVTSVATELDPQGALWLHYTDATGSWIERRICS